MSNHGRHGTRSSTSTCHPTRVLPHSLRSATTIPGPYEGTTPCYPEARSAPPGLNASTAVRPRRGLGENSPHERIRTRSLSGRDQQHRPPIPSHSQESKRRELSRAGPEPYFLELAGSHHEPSALHSGACKTRRGREHYPAPRDLECDASRGKATGTQGQQ
jgi:hypothetical protein